MQDNGYLTDLRTAAAGALAAKELCIGVGNTGNNKKKVQLCVIGCGVQARMQALAIKEVVEIEENVKCWNRTKSNGVKFVAEMAELGVTIILCDTVGEALKDCSLVVTTTCSTDAIVKLEHLNKKNCTIIAVGSDTPGKREVGGCVLGYIVGNGGLIVGDKKEQVLRLGECQWGSAGIAGFEECIVELGDIVSLKKGGRKGEEMILVDLTGVGAQDAAVAGEVYKCWAAENEE